MDIDETLVLLYLDSGNGAVSIKEVDKFCCDHDCMKVCIIAHKRHLAYIQVVMDSEPVDKCTKCLSVKCQCTMSPEEYGKRKAV
jgi:hypothetical protein